MILIQTLCLPIGNVDKFNFTWIKKGGNKNSFPVIAMNLTISATRLQNITVWWPTEWNSLPHRLLMSMSCMSIAFKIRFSAFPGVLPEHITSRSLSSIFNRSNMALLDRSQSPIFPWDRRCARDYTFIDRAYLTLQCRVTNIGSGVFLNAACLMWDF